MAAKIYASCTGASYIRQVLFFAPLFLMGCNTSEPKKDEGNKLFSLLPSSSTGINFANDVKYTEQLNVYTYRNFYNGGGVGIGDINNDGLPDVFLCGNQKSNRLYLNKGNFQFEDITDKAGLSSAGVWSTGVTFADVNGDGLLDIYICKSGDFSGKNRSNQLFINNGNLTFTEKAAEYGLNNKGLCTHAVFFDYDHDGDLDCYLLNNSFRSVGNYDLIKDQRNIPDPLGGNKLYRNDGGHFKDVTQQAGIYSSKIGFGLGVTISDVNGDGWDDIYVSNDFFERDYLYINNRDGTFKECLTDAIRELSQNSMGADIADINNDGYPDIYVTDMLPEPESRLKTKTAFENWDKYQSDLQNGYYQQFLRNVLQLNQGSVMNKNLAQNKINFSEIGRLSGVHATDWSWGALISDMDNDGFKDIFVSNGIYKDLTDQDYIQFMANPIQVRKMMGSEKEVIKKLIDSMPSEAVPNYAYRNNGDLTFTNKAAEWGLGDPGFSNGSAYGDLNNDGALDLVVNNVNMPAFIYRNNSRKLKPANKYLKVVLQGEGKNRFGVGAQVTLYYNHTLNYQEQVPSRGFESSVDTRLNFGLGKIKEIDSIVVKWPCGKQKVLKGVKPNQTITVKEAESGLPGKAVRGAAGAKPVFEQSRDNHGIDFVHKENDFIDFDREKLIFQMHSTDGPRIGKGDVNGDGLEDFYICGAKDQPGALYIQTRAGRFKRSNEKLFEQDKASEDTDCLFFDADGDGDQDLYVCSGGNEFSANSTDLIDRLYINNGKGNFSKSQQVLPSFQFESSSCVTAADVDGDGDQDLFVGVRLKPGEYGYPCKGYLLQNNGKGFFTDVTEERAPGLTEFGMVTDAKWFDYDRDGKPDLVACGEYMPIRLFHNEGGRLKEVTREAGLEWSNGWWNRLEIADIDGDDYPDIVAGNHGLNSRFKATRAKPVSMYVGDFSGTGSIEDIVCTYNGYKQYPMALRHDLVGELPYLKKKYLRYAQYKEQTMEDIFGRDLLQKMVKLDACEMRSSVLLNKRNGKFLMKPLPVEAQFSTVFGLVVKDYDGDGKKDIVLGGNFYQSKPEAGIYDASYGLLLKGDGKGGFTAVKPQVSGIVIKGAVRDMKEIKAGNNKLLIVAKNNDKTEVLSFK
ncbi:MULTISPECIES: VCBS repeat-containing protein [Mucilaginibacter]|uniref:VCBS repeat-containing protein n=2 Tax=Mucilaginibacter rubeus TaxID=2027860 RepID=A0ABX7U7Z8_9SPHI|nr:MULTISPECIES: VCBS repeat-containing protein [Mucilaginibacter]QTE42263.1 VCBS repeat-containing protein [Mucilaginibacter rubeus]QTE48864.1 VCBS repeat-containing protein [Mucilaginibacter rubeus]QTE53961.1 VCBS repeat-containing protein [Mucilaginibacter rubeus]QTE66584.1 VCBS repeat-containing protein [Mucilaginibacter rubeus]QTF65331.1 VCBS repeat-containing protein [Mucilaginibacter rubeus]